MIKDILKTALISLALGFLLELSGIWLKTSFLQEFFKNNLVTILVALLAINATTMGIILSKIRDLIDKHGGDEFFKNTKKSMLISIQEQIGLIIAATIVLAAKSSEVIKQIDNLPLLLNSITTAIFIYALLVLYDIAKGVLIIVEYDIPSDK
ncbi:hypothetical protein KDW99_08755 [Marinomonas rhizomae]|uniref:hypothetical protein n=1 Tax=Marinomonas rhizomae TaxID=491948 RepID=UPI002101F8ED|nr:hypothetical protein [Marinomonas rhizomae]UTW01197.1 hypothetical protein KDW99_08755 [Marinomonas rhizomae]